MKLVRYLSLAIGLAIPLAVLFDGSNIVNAQQTTADIVGTVTDPSGAVVPAANITVENRGTHESRGTLSTSAGDYVVNLLKPGTYSVTVTAPGFQNFAVKSVTLAPGDRTRVNAILSIGNASQTITVTTIASTLQTESSVLSNDIGEQTTQDLPLNGRNFTTLIQLQPGVNEGTSATGGLIGGGQLDDQRQGATFQANGQPEVMNNQQIDGADNYERVIGSIAVRPSVDSISQMTVQTNTYSAEIGRTGGAMVNIITKSGTDQFHGDVFEFFRNDVLNTNNFNFGRTIPKAEWRQNQYGGSLGGPIRKDKAFFFGSYEGYRLVQGLAPTTTLVPTAAEVAEAKNGQPIDFSDRDPNDPNYSSTPIPIAQLDAAGVAYLQFYPSTGIGTGTTKGNNGQPVAVPTYTAGSTRRQNSSVYDARTDYSFNPNNTAYGRFIYNTVMTSNNGNFPKATVAGKTLYPTAGATGSDKDWDLLLNYIHTFSPHLVLELKAAYTRSDNQSLPGTEGTNPNTAIGQPNINTNFANADASGLAGNVVFNGTGVGGVNYLPLKDQDNTYQYLGALTLTRGRHNMKFGSGVIRRQVTQLQSGFSEGLWQFVNYPLLARGQFVTNFGRSLALVIPHFRVWEPSVYFQDDWHARDNLTLNLGLRYEIFTPYSEIMGRVANWDNSTQTYLIGGQNTGHTGGVQTDYHGLSPRLGFAYSPDKDHTFVIRGGFAMSYYPENVTLASTLKNPPFVATSQACNSPGFGGSTCAAGFQSFINGLPPLAAANINNPGATIPFATSTHFRTSYAEQFNLTVQKDWKGNVLSISTVGLLGRHLYRLLDDLNAAPPGVYTGSQFQQARPFYSKYPNVGTVGYAESGGKSTYYALQTSFERRMKNGLSFNVNYTQSRQLDNAMGPSQEVGTIKGGFGSVPTQINTRDYSNSGVDFRSHMAATLSYELPFGRGAKGLSAALIAGWKTNFIQVWTSGEPFTVVNSSCIGQEYPGCNDRPNQVAGYKLSKPTLGQFFNTSAFVAQPAGTLGNERRYQLYGPHYRHSDFSVFKAFPVREGANIEFRAEAFNLSNTANWGLPNYQLGGSNYGAITAMSFSYTPRVLQFALKLNF